MQSKRRKKAGKIFRLALVITVFVLIIATPIPTPIAEKKKYPVGVYEGGGYSAKGIYRPAYDCRMKTNEYPEFCPVCQRAIRRMIEFYVP